MKTLLIVILTSMVLCSGIWATESTATEKIQQDKNPAAGSFKVTFIELGSVRCTPCKKMVPIMQEIEKEYAGQVKVIFYDVWTDEGKPFAQKYKIRLIPTQVFLDQNGNEYFRHEGFFPKEELVNVLKQKGVK